MQDELLTPEEVAARLRTTRAALAQLRVKGLGPKPTKVGNRVLYLASELEAWLKSGGDKGVGRRKPQPAILQPATENRMTGGQPTPRERAYELGRRLGGREAPTPETLPSFAHLIGLRLRDNQP